MTLYDDLLFYYKFDEANGTTADNATGNAAYDGIFDDTPVWGEAGKISNCVRVAADHYVETGYAPPDSAFTISCWMKATANTTDNASLFSSSNPAAGYNGFDLRIDISNNNKCWMQVWTGAGWSINATANTVVCDGTWKHIVLTFDGNQTWALYVNNGANDLTDSTGALTAGHNLHLFASANHDQKYTGSMDEFGFWTRVLSSDEITELYNGGSGITYPFPSDKTVVVGSALSLSTTSNSPIYYIIVNSLEVSGSLNIQTVLLSGMEPIMTVPGTSGTRIIKTWYPFKSALVADITSQIGHQRSLIPEVSLIPKHNLKGIK